MNMRQIVCEKQLSWIDIDVTHSFIPLTLDKQIIISLNVIVISDQISAKYKQRV